MSSLTELNLQENFSWDRSLYSDYNNILAYYQSISCLENCNKGSLLDLACGEGILTSHYEHFFDEVVGVDAAKKHLIKARERISRGKFYHSTIEEFNLSKKFDNIFLLLILEHVKDPVAVLKKASSFLKENGKIIVHVPNANAINRRLAVKMGTLISCEELSPFDINVVGHRRSYTIDSLNLDIRKAGLKTINSGGIFYKMLSYSQMDWFLKNGKWDSGHGWGRSNEKQESKNWKKEFCRACYEIGKEQPNDCNIIFSVIQK